MSSDRASKVLSLAIMAVTLVLCACYPNEERGAWAIVKQRGMENYGFVTEMGEGFVIAGFTNKASAIAAMEEWRWNIRNPPQKPKPKKFDGVWEKAP